MALLQTLTDTFTGGSLGAIWSTNSSRNQLANGSPPDSVVTVVQSGGVLTITPSTTGTYYNSIQSATTYDLTNSYFLAKVAQACNTAAVSADAEMTVGINEANWIRFIQENGTLFFEYLVASAQTVVTNITYDPVAHLWWRIRQGTAGGGAIGHVYWDTSPDGTTWTNQATTTTTPITVTAVYAELAAGTWQAESSPGAAVFDNVNPPATMSVTVRPSSVIGVDTAPPVSVAVTARAVGTARLHYRTATLPHLRPKPRT